MRQAITKIADELYYVSYGKRVYGPNPNMRGVVTGLRGIVTGLSGDCSGLSGDCSGLRGNLDDCELTDEDRENGIDLADLVERTS